MGNVFLEVLLMIAIQQLGQAENGEHICPTECDCYLFRINWVIDCSGQGLRQIPVEGLDPEVYILNLADNRLVDVPMFPEGIPVRTLYLAENQIQEVDAHKFSPLHHLIDLDLSSNNIKHVQRDAFVECPGLLTLEMSRNPLDPVEGPFLDSLSLRYLDISFCNLTHFNPWFFKRIPALTKLDISGNHLQHLAGNTFSPLTSLEDLILNNCGLSTIEKNAFASLESVKNLELSGNFLVSGFEWAAPLVALERLDLRRSGIVSVPENSFFNNTWLSSLTLAENHIKDLDIATTLGGNLRYLDYLDLTNCNLRGPLTEEAFGNASKLRTLLLTGNRLSSDDIARALGPLTRLKTLSLKNCNLKRLPDNTFDRLTFLQDLDISYNPLVDAFTPLLSPLESLRRLDMSYCNLSHISRATFSKMTFLHTLVLSGNQLKTLENGLFENLTHLRVLELNSCGLKKLKPTVFNDDVTYPELEELKLGDNPLEVPRKGSFLPSQVNALRSLSLQGCNITTLPKDSFMGLINLRNLFLTNNSISGDPEFLEPLQNLERLDLSHNNLSFINPFVFKNNPLISEVILIGNPWECSCHISDLWEWALTVKGDLNVLKASTSSENTRPRTKKKKVLTCTMPDKSNKTWARFVRESSCDSTHRIKPMKLLPPPKLEELVASESKSTYVWIVLLVTVTSSVALLIFSAAKKSVIICTR